MTRVPVVRPVVHKAVRNIARASVGVLVAGLLIGQAAPALATTAAVPVLNTAGQAAAALRPADLPHGPDTCKNGFVWREARPADHVCVTPATRQTTSDENRLAASRVDPNGAFGAEVVQVGLRLARGLRR